MGPRDAAVAVGSHPVTNVAAWRELMEPQRRDRSITTDSKESACIPDPDNDPDAVLVLDTLEETRPATSPAASVDALVADHGQAGLAEVSPEEVALENQNAATPTCVWGFSLWEAFSCRRLP